MNPTLTFEEYGYAPDDPTDHPIVWPDDDGQIRGQESGGYAWLDAVTRGIDGTPKDVDVDRLRRAAPDGHHLVRRRWTATEPDRVPIVMVGEKREVTGEVVSVNYQEGTFLVEVPFDSATAASA